MSNSIRTGLLFTFLAMSAPAQDVLHTDAYSAGEILEIMTRTTGSIENGDTMLRSEFLKQIDLSLDRASERREEQINMVLIETWRLAPDWDVSWMIAVQGDRPIDNPEIYGVRIIHRGTGRAVARSWTD